jgi:preprotein translocase subunit SecG
LFGSAQTSGRTRRGLEKTLFQFTIVLTALFLAVSIVSVRFAPGP